MKAGHSVDLNRDTTEFLIIPRDGSGDRMHIVFDLHGNEIFRRDLK